jgi:ATP adenylyltransferase
MSGLEQLWAGWRSSYIEGVTTSPPPFGPNGCVFCGLLASDLEPTETHVIWRHPESLVAAILNAYPYASGHVMVMPVRHVGDIEELTDAEAAALWDGVSRAVSAVKSAYRPDGLNVGANLGKAAGAGVPGHLHVHVLPRWIGDTNFMTSIADARVLPEPLSATDTKLRDAWRR